MSSRSVDSVDAVVARLVMLEAEVRHDVAEREQPVVVAIVVRAEDGGGLVDEPSVLRGEIVRRLRGLGALGEKIQRVPQRRMADQIDLAQRRPSCTGESMTVVSEAGSKWISSPLRPRVSSAVAYNQPAGMRSDAST